MFALQYVKASTYEITCSSTLLLQKHWLMTWPWLWKINCKEIKSIEFVFYPILDRMNTL